MKLTLIDRHIELPGCETFRFQPEAKFNFQSGQFLRYNLPHTPFDDRGTSRFFTIAAAPSEDFIQITTRWAPERGSTFKQHLQELPIGAELMATGPLGEFTLPPDPQSPVVLVAGGIGITPYRSMLKWLDDTKQDRPIQLLYAARNPTDFVFAELFNDIATRLSSLAITYIAAAGGAGWTGPTGLLDGARMKELVSGFDSKLVYLSGPQPMVEKLETELTAVGLDAAQIKTDYFPGYAEI